MTTIPSRPCSARTLHAPGAGHGTGSIRGSRRRRPPGRRASRRRSRGAGRRRTASRRRAAMGRLPLGTNPATGPMTCQAGVVPVGRTRNRDASSVLRSIDRPASPATATWTSLARTGRPGPPSVEGSRPVSQTVEGEQRAPGGQPEAAAPGTSQPSTMARPRAAGSAFRKPPTVTGPPDGPAIVPRYVSVPSAPARIAIARVSWSATADCHPGTVEVSSWEHGEAGDAIDLDVAAVRPAEPAGTGRPDEGDPPPRARGRRGRPRRRRP